jgi:hypothetical protein
MARDPSPRISEGHALKILQALHAAGVDVLARGSADVAPVLHVAAGGGAPAVVRWLVTVAGAPVDEGDCEGCTPLLTTLRVRKWAAAQALLDCGARVNGQHPSMDGRSPIMLAVEWQCDLPLLRRLLAAHPDCLTGTLLRDRPVGLHTAASRNPGALPLLVGSGLPHLAEALNKIAAGSAEDRAPTTLLHFAIAAADWDAALALLAAGARVGIVGGSSDYSRSIAQWAGDGFASPHRGLRVAAAARAWEHVAEALAGAAAGASAGGSAPPTTTSEAARSSRFDSSGGAPCAGAGEAPAGAVG